MARRDRSSDGKVTPSPAAARYARQPNAVGCCRQVRCRAVTGALPVFVHARTRHAPASCGKRSESAFRVCHVARLSSMPLRSSGAAPPAATIFTPPPCRRRAATSQHKPCAAPDAADKTAMPVSPAPLAGADHDPPAKALAEVNVPLCGAASARKRRASSMQYGMAHVNGHATPPLRAARVDTPPQRMPLSP